MSKIVADTTSCLPISVQTEFDISLVPQLIHFGEDSYTEGIDIGTDTFLSLVKSSDSLPKTSATYPQQSSPMPARDQWQWASSAERKPCWNRKIIELLLHGIIPSLHLFSGVLYECQKT